MKFDDQEKVSAGVQDLGSGLHVAGFGLHVSGFGLQVSVLPREMRRWEHISPGLLVSGYWRKSIIPKF